MNILEIVTTAELILQLAEKAPELVLGKTFVTPSTAKALGIVECLTCSDEGHLTKGTEVIGCPDCDS